MVFRGRRIRGRWNKRFMALFGWVVVFPIAIVIILWAIGLWLDVPRVMPN